MEKIDDLEEFMELNGVGNWRTLSGLAGKAFTAKAKQGKSKKKL